VPNKQRPTEKKNKSDAFYCQWPDFKDESRWYSFRSMKPGISLWYGFLKNKKDGKSLFFVFKFRRKL